MIKRSPFRHFKTSPEIIRLAVMMYRHSQRAVALDHVAGTDLSSWEYHCVLSLSKFRAAERCAVVCKVAVRDSDMPMQLESITDRHLDHRLRRERRGAPSNMSASTCMSGKADHRRRLAFGNG